MPKSLKWFIKKGLLIKDKTIKNLAKLFLNKARNHREIAQYSVTKKTTKDITEETKKDAHKFVDRMEEVFDII